MRIAYVVGSVVVPALLVVTAGCGGGNRPSDRVLPGSQGRLGATVSGDGVLPAERRPPDGASVLTTTTMRSPIGRTSSPVVRSSVPVTRPPLQLGATTTTTTLATTTTTDVLGGTATPRS